MTAYRQLREQIKSAGITPQDTVVIHSSLKSIGEVEGRAEGLIAAFCDHLQEGLLIIPTHTWANVHAKQPIFDVRSSKPCIGALPTVAAFHPAAVRSLHPTHSMAVFGKRAAEYVKGEQRFCDPMPPESCWGRLYDERAKLLLVGVGQQRNTFIHAIEERAGVPNRLTAEPVPFTVVDAVGNAIPHALRTHITPGTRDVSLNFVRMNDILERAGVVKRAMIGEAETVVCDAHAMTDLLLPIFQDAIRRGVDLFAD